MSHYWTIPGFEGLYLEESWVLDVCARPQELELAMDFVLRESHPSYSPPAPDEQYCYRRGELRFEAVTSLIWDRQGTPPAVDATGSDDYGSIDEFTATDGTYVLEGDFGRITVGSDMPTVVLSDETAR